MQVTRKTEGQFSVAADRDSVIGFVPLAIDNVLEQMWMDIHLFSNDLDVNDAFWYGVTGMIMRVPDPDNVDTVDDIWDRMVPKDLAFGAGIDQDETDVVISPEFELGEPEISSIVGNRDPMGNLEFFRKRERISFANSPFAFQTGTPDTYTGLDSFKSRAKINEAVMAHSVAVLAFSNPAMDITSATIWNSPVEHEWSMLQFLEVFLYDFWKQLLGLIETGAETPYAEAASFLTQLLEPTVIEETAGAYLSATRTVYSGTTWQTHDIGHVQAGISSE